MAALDAAPFPHAIDNFRRPDGTPLIVPQPQRYEARAGKYAFSGTLTVDAPEEIVLDYLNDALARFSCKAIRTGPSAQCRFVLTGDGVPGSDEGYTLEITDKGILVKARTTAGLFYGAVTLSCLIRNAERPELDCCSVIDWPSFPYRCYALRISNVPPEKLGRIKDLIDAMAKLKFNCLSLEVGEAFPYRNAEFVRAGCRHSRAGMTELRDWCRTRHIKIMPTLQVLSHNAWLSTHADWDKMKEGEPDKPWNSQPCIRNDEARRITLNCIREQIVFFAPEIMYVSLDEIVLGPFRQCPRCRNVPAMTLLADYVKFLHEGLRDLKVRLLFSYDSFSGKYGSRWPWGGEFLRCLDPRRDLVSYWNYRDEVPLDALDPFKGFTLFGTCLAGKPLNVQRMAQLIAGYKGEGIRMTHWYFSRGGSYADFRTETPDSLGGFPQGAEYLWNLRDTYHAEFTYDGVCEMLRLLRPGAVADRGMREAGTPLPIARSVNAELSRSGMFPELDDNRAIRLKQILAERPEHFELLTAPGGRYYGMCLSGDREIPGRSGIRFGAGDRKFKTLSLLMTASRPYNIVDYLSIDVYGRKRFRTPAAARLVLAYADGEKHEVPLRFRCELTDWGQIQGGVNMRWGVRGIDVKERYFSFGVCDIANPRPDVPVRNIVFGSCFLDGISPVILAVSLKGADRPFGPEAFDPEKIRSPYRGFGIDVLAVHTVVRYDFETGMPEDLRVAGVGRFSGKIGAEIADDPGRGKVLRITVPPGKPDRAGGVVRINISMPFRYDGRNKGLVSRMRIIAAPGDLRGVTEYLHTRRPADPRTPQDKFRAFRAPKIGPEWTAVHYRWSGKLSRGNELTDLAEANTRRICVTFHQVGTPAEIFIDDIGELTIDYDAMADWTVGAERERHR